MLEDRSVHILLINRTNHSRCVHSRQMLNRTRDTTCNIEGWTHDLRLTNLFRMFCIVCINSGTRCTSRGTKCLGYNGRINVSKLSLLLTERPPDTIRSASVRPLPSVTQRSRRSSVVDHCTSKSTSTRPLRGNFCRWQDVARTDCKRLHSVEICT